MPRTSSSKHYSFWLWLLLAWAVYRLLPTARERRPWPSRGTLGRSNGSGKPSSHGHGLTRPLPLTGTPTYHGSEGTTWTHNPGDDCASTPRIVGMHDMGASTRGCSILAAAAPRGGCHWQGGADGPRPLSPCSSKSSAESRPGARRKSIQVAMLDFCSWPASGTRASGNSPARGGTSTPATPRRTSIGDTSCSEEAAGRRGHKPPTDQNYLV
jgi:hypothetical protein